MKISGSGKSILTATRITVLPENCNEMCLTISALLDRIRSEEGCRAFNFYRDADDQCSMLLIGEWDSRVALDTHLNSDHFAVLLGSMRVLSNRSNFDFNLLSHVAGIEALTAARCEQYI